MSNKPICDSCGDVIHNEPSYEDRETILCSACCPTKEKLLAPSYSVADVRYLSQLAEMVANSNEGKAMSTEYIIMGDSLKVEEEEKKKLPTPKRIHSKLDEYVVGQEATKRVLSIAAYNHYKKTTSNSLKCVKSNILLIGPTGCGKTLLAQNLAKILDVPFVITDATSLTQAGYVGEDVESILKLLLSKANNNLKKAEKGIVFIDEIDKLRKDTGDGGKKDVSGEGVQQGLLKLIEGSKVPVEVGSGMSKSTIHVDTSKILFICSGSFAGLEDIINRRVGTKSSIGFNNPVEKVVVEENVLKKVTISDLKIFGMIPEFLGRLPIVTALSQLTTEEMERIIKEPKDSLLKQFTELLRYDNVDLKFTAGAMRAIAKRAIENGTGARGLRAIIEEILEDVMYEAPSVPGEKLAKITQKMVEKGESPIVEVIK